MKKYLFWLPAVLILAACSSAPPKPYGKAFPINGHHIQKAEGHVF